MPFEFFLVIERLFTLQINLGRSTVVHSNSIPPKEHQIDMAMKNMQLTEASNRQFRYGDGIPIKTSRTSQAPNKMPPGIFEVPVL